MFVSVLVIMIFLYDSTPFSFSASQEFHICDLQLINLS
jgi:hypothetical protein